MTILLFGITRDIVGNGSLSIPMEKAGKISTVGALKSYMVEMYPDLGTLTSLAVAVNKAYARDAEEITNFDEIALIPPVSGG